VRCELAGNALAGHEQFAKCEPAASLNEVNPIAPALGVQHEIENVVASRRVLEKRNPSP
jgi:hypothetical protein